MSVPTERPATGLRRRERGLLGADVRWKGRTDPATVARRTDLRLRRISEEIEQIRAELAALLPGDGAAG